MNNQPRNYLAQIESIYAIVSVDEGGEGVVAFQHSGTWIPLIAADETRLRELMPHARKIAKTSRMPLRLVRFTTREVIEEITP